MTNSLGSKSFEGENPLIKIKFLFSFSSPVDANSIISNKNFQKV